MSLALTAGEGIGLASEPGDILRLSATGASASRGLFYAGGMSPTKTAAQNSTAGQAAIDEAAAAGGILTFPAGDIPHNGLVFKNKVSYRAAGHDTGAAKGTILRYTGTGDGVQINNPINSSTPANISVEDITFKNANRNAGKGCFADTGSSHLKFLRCAFIGGDHGLILDQSELADIYFCDFEANASGGTSGLWLVNGALRTVGASSQFTNRISAVNCQFNGSATACGIIDDGGACHSFINNNYNGCLHHIRAAGVEGLLIIGGEWESSTGVCLRLDAFAHDGTTAVGACTGTSVQGGVMVPGVGQAAIISYSGSLEVGGGLQFATNVTAIQGTGNMFDYAVGQVRQAGAGALDDGYGTNTHKRQLFAAAAPASGAHRVGEIVYNNAPTAGGKIGWVCVTAGSPGTWKPWGAIDA